MNAITDKQYPSDTAEAPSKSIEHEGFKLLGSALTLERGYAAQVTITGRDKQRIFTLRQDPDGFPTAAIAINAAINYGRAIIQGDIPGMSTNDMY